MIPARAFLTVVAILIAIAFGTGHLRWNTKQPGCFNDKHFYGDFHTTLSIGNLELRQRDFGCPASDQYDKKLFKRI